MIEVSQEFLAQLAKSNDENLNKKPLQKGDYSIDFELDGIQYHFAQTNGRWVWDYKTK